MVTYGLKMTDGILLQVPAVESTDSEEIFTILMGDAVRRQFVEESALDVKNLDI